MSDMPEVVFTTREFARLCGTTKDTLFHYEEVGLLKPRRRANGYREYTAEDFFVFNIIQVLQQTGSSLEEIGEHLAHHDTERTLALFEEKRRELAVKRQQLEQMEHFLAQNIAVMEFAMQAVYDEPKVEEQPEERLLVVPLEAGEGDNLEGITLRLSDHFKTCRQGGLLDRFPLGSIIPYANVLVGSDEESYFTSQVPEDFVGGPLVTKPKGRYATLLHKGDYASFGQGYAILLEYIRRERLTVTGDCYVRDLVSYLASSVEEHFVLQISIQVV